MSISSLKRLILFTKQEILFSNAFSSFNLKDFDELNNQLIYLFMDNNKDIYEYTKYILNHENGYVSFHDSFLKVISEKKYNNNFKLNLSGSGFLCDKFYEKGSVLVDINMQVSSSFRRINNKEINSMYFLDDCISIIYKDNGKLKFIISNIWDVAIEVGDVVKYKSDIIERHPATIIIQSKNQELYKLDAFWLSNRTVEVKENNFLTLWDKYDLSNFNYFLRADIFLNKNPSIKSKLKQDNDHNFFHTNRCLDNYLKKPKPKLNLKL